MSHTLERAGRIVGFVGRQAMVRLDPSTGCGSCGSRGACASGDKSGRVVRMSLPSAAHVGDRIVVSMPASSVALAALLGYLLPPASLLAGAVIAAMSCGGDAAAVAGAGVGLALGLLLARLIFRFTLGRDNVASSICEPDIPHGEPS